MRPDTRLSIRVFHKPERCPYCNGILHRKSLHDFFVSAETTAHLYCGERAVAYKVVDRTQAILPHGTPRREWVLEPHRCRNRLLIFKPVRWAEAV